MHDTARRHGRVRVGSASTFVRSDDEAMLAELLADRRSATLGLRRLAPTVLSAQADPTTVLSTLRRIGLAPAAEGHDGGVVVQRRGAHRATTSPRRLFAGHAPAGHVPAGHAPAGQAPPVDAAGASRLVRALRAADRVPPGSGHAAAASAAPERPGRGAVRPPAVPVLDPAASLELLRSAAAEERTVWVGISDPLGTVERLLLEPLSVEAGRVSALDVAHGRLRNLSVHRVTGVADASPAGRFSREGATSPPESQHPDDPEER